MSRARFEIDPVMETRMMELIDPAVVDVYNLHMTTGARKGADASDVVVGTLDPLEEMYKAAGLEPQDRITSDLLDAVRDSFEQQLEVFATNGVDAAPAIALAAQMNLGTEDNITWYHTHQYVRYQGNPSFLELLRRWTTEETFHGPLIRKWGELSGSISASSAHAATSSLVFGGIGVETRSVVAINAFTDPQEYDTADAHNNLGKVLDPIGRTIMNVLAGQERRHGLMFRGLGKAIYSLDQEFIDYALPIEAETHRSFAMPAAESYPNFQQDALQIAVHGLFTFEGVLRRQRSRVEALELLKLPATTEKAKKAQETIANYTDPTSRVNVMRQRIIDQARDQYVNAEKSVGRVPLILGLTVDNKTGTLQVFPEAV